MTNKDLQVSVHGPAITIQDAIDAGAATKELLDALTEQVAPGQGLTWRVASVQLKCDGCGFLRPDRPGPDEGWTYRDGDDLCPSCSAVAS